MSSGAPKIGSPSSSDRSTDELCINTIRTLSMDAVQQAEVRPPWHADGFGAGHLHVVAALSAL